MSAKDSQELKQLYSRKGKIEIKLEEATRKASEKQKEASRLRNELNSINNKIKSMKNRNIIVTEHAILRYLERVMGLDLDQIKKEILTEEIEGLTKSLGNGKYPISKTGAKAVIKDNSVISVIN